MDGSNEEQLFLFELLIDTIVFSEGAVPQKKHIICNCNFESIVSFEIRAEGSGAIEKEERDSKRRDMEFNMGKSYLFTVNPLELLKAIDTYPLEISICTRMNPLPYGTSIVDWGSEFSDMVQAASESYGYVTPAAIYGLYNLRDFNGLPIGSVDLFIRLSCFGKNIQTNFQVLQQPGKDGLPGPRQFLFKYTNAGTTFMCERYGMGTSQEVLPVAPIYNATNIEPVSQFKTLFSNAASRQSVMPFLDLDFLNREQQFDFASFLLEVHDTCSDTLSLRIRPDDMKTINIVGLLKEMQEKDAFVTSSSDDGSAASLSDLTAEEINKRLCKNPNCPAAIKFKEYGLGPLAKGNGTGCALLGTKTPFSYGLSHANGTMNNYGPFGIFTRPKNPEQPFVPKKKPSRLPSIDSDITKKKKRNSKQCVDVSCIKTSEQRLRGGSDLNETKHTHDTHKPESIELKPLRPMTSINDPFSAIYDRSDVLRLRGGISYPQLQLTNRIEPRYFHAPNALYYRLESYESDTLTSMNEYVSAISRSNVLRLRGGRTRKVIRKKDVNERQETNDASTNDETTEEDLLDEESSLNDDDTGTYNESQLGLSETDLDSSLCLKNGQTADDSRNTERIVNGNDSRFHFNMTATDFLSNDEDETSVSPRKNDTKTNDLTIKTKLRASSETSVNINSGNLRSPKNDTSLNVDSTQNTSRDYVSPSITFGVIRYYKGKDVPLRLKGGWSGENMAKNAPFMARNCAKPLRLVGGGLFNEDERPNPMSAVKELMQDFDKVVVAYRRALGPCGQGTCPFAPNVVDESCRKVCRGNELNSDHQTPIERLIECESCSLDEEEEELTACGAPTCPYGRLNTKSETEEELKRMQTKPACGDFTCPFVKRKLNIYDEDVVDLDILPRNCGVPTCKFTPQKDLPPIHWDCPEPLPSGRCKNPNCPLLPQLLKCYEPKCVCDLPNCAYAMPPSCGNPTCPFKQPRMCPYATQQQQLQQQPCPYGNPSTACPFENITTPSPNCANPQCDYGKTVESCPFTSNSKCGNPDCPYAEELEACPFALNPPKDPNAICPNPQCPYAPEPRKKSTLPQPPKSSQTCSSPQPPQCCPSPPCYPTAPPCYGSAPCYPSSPCFASPPCFPAKSVCSDPTCPFREVICTNPVCQLSSPLCDPDTCPLLQPPEPLLPDSDDDDNKECQCPPCLALQEEFCEECFRERQAAAQTLFASFGLGPKEDVIVGKELTPCCSATCRMKGGELICETCANVIGGTTKTKKKYRRRRGDKGKDTLRSFGGGAATVKTLPDIADIKQKYKGKYVYNMGNDYPGVKIGHRQCVDRSFRVPYNMGWMWHIYSTPCMGLKPRYGWKPGAISYTIANIIKKHRESKGLPMQFPPDPNRARGKKRCRGPDGVYSVYGSESEESIPPKPTLQIKKKEGTYFITMNPLKDPYTIEDNENPYVDCTPMQFRITKNKKNKKNRDLAIMDDRGDGEYKTCFCNDVEEKPVEESSSDSELDIEFTPPAGIIRPERLKRKKTVVHTDTQYNPNDYKQEEGGKKGKGKGKGKKEKGGKGKKGGKKTKKK